MIDKLTESEMIMPYVVGQKLNELIEVFNKHYHKSLDTNYFTTEPWDKPVEVAKESPPS